MNIASFNSNFYWRISGRGISFIFGIAILPLVLLLDIEEIALFFFLRASVQYFVGLIIPIISGNNFFRKGTEAYKSNSLKVFFLQHFFKSFLVSAIFCSFFLFLMSMLTAYDFVNLSFNQLMLVIFWAFSRLAHSSFHHIFQLNKNHFFSGLANGSLASILQFIFIIFAINFENYNLSVLLLSAGLSFSLSTLFFIFIFLANTKYSKKSFDKSFFNSSECYQEGLTNVFNQPAKYFLIIAFYFLSEYEMSFIGMAIYIWQVLALLPNTLIVSQREYWNDAKKDQTAFKKLKARSKKQILFIQFLMLFGILILTILLKSFDLESIVSKQKVVIDAVEYVLAILVGMICINLINVSYYESIVIIFGGTQYVTKNRILSFLYSNILFFLLIFFVDIYAVLISILFSVLYLSITYNQFLERHQYERSNN